MNWENPEPLEFMQRLAAPVPRPWLHLIRFHGVLAPNRSCALKSFPVRQSLQPSTQPSRNSTSPNSDASGKSHRI